MKYFPLSQNSLSIPFSTGAGSATASVSGSWLVGFWCSVCETFWGGVSAEVPRAAGGVASPRLATDWAMPGTESSLPSSIAGIINLYSHHPGLGWPTNAVLNPLDFLMDFHHFFLCCHTDIVQQLDAFSYKLFLKEVRLVTSDMVLYICNCIIIFELSLLWRRQNLSLPCLLMLLRLCYLLVMMHQPFFLFQYFILLKYRDKSI